MTCEHCHDTGWAEGPLRPFPCTHCEAGREVAEDEAAQLLLKDRRRTPPLPRD